MEYSIGDKIAANKLGFRGRQLLTFCECKKCKRKRWVRPGYEKDYICVSCFHRKSIKGKNMNSAAHLDTCKCHRCRIGKGYFKGKNNPMWRGGMKLSKSGYVLRYVEDEDPMACMRTYDRGKYIMEHRLVMARHLKRPLLKNETVHHKNGIRNDNRISNLELWSSNHHSGQRVSDKVKWAIQFLKQYNYKIEKL